MLTCVGVVVVLIFLACLFNFPKQTLVVTGVLIAIAVVGVMSMIESERQKTAQRERDANAINISVSYSPSTCSSAQPLLVSVGNGSARTLNAVRFYLGAYRPGRSTNLLSYHSIDFDRILPPSQRGDLCFQLPTGLSYDPGSLPILAFRAEDKRPIFAD